MTNLPFQPIFLPPRVGRRSRGSRRLYVALTALLIALGISAAALAGPDQIAFSNASNFRASSEKFDFHALETKIRNSEAIDLFSKISLKIEITSLVNEAVRLHEGKSAAGLYQRKVRFEELIDRAVIMLRKGDVSLAEEVEGSREALWRFLNSPEKLLAFADLNDDRLDD